MFKQIFGVPEGSVAAVAQRQSEASPRYMPASRLTREQLDGVGHDGSVWQPWRIERATGEQWYQRISQDMPAAPIIANDGEFDDE